MSAPKKKVRDWYLAQALESFASLNRVLTELTEDEVFAALELESQSRRRRSIMNRLISRATRLNEIVYSNSLKEKFNVTCTIQSSVPC